MRRTGLVHSTAQTAVLVAAALTVAADVLAVRFRPDAWGLGLGALALVCISVPLVGAAAVRHDAANPVGWLLLVCGVSVPLALSAYLYSHAAYDGARLPAARWAAWLDGWPWTPALTTVPVVGLLLFPSGRLPSRRWRPVLALALLVVGAQLVNELFAPHLLDYPHLANPTALPDGLAKAADGLAATIVLVPPLVTAAAVATTVRSRSAGPQTRPALRLVVPGAWAIAASWWGCVVAVAATGDSNKALPLELSGLAALAAVSWAAIRRYGLLDGRRVVTQAIVYAGLSLGVLAAYLLAAALIDTAVSGAARGSIAALVAALAALPLRQLLQTGANRLVNGDRDNPYAAVARLRQDVSRAAQPGAVLPAIVDTVRSALRLPHVAIQTADEKVAAGTPVAETEQFPLVFAGEQIGVLIAGHRDRGEAFTAVEHDLLTTIAGLVATAAHAVTMTGEALRSRTRLVTAAEEERRRIRRDLHDSVGGSLAAVILGLQTVRRRVGPDSEPAATQLDDLTVQTRDVLAEVRDLVYNLRPPALDELGLVGALTAYAHSLGDIHVQGPDPAPALTAAVEVAAYRIAVEAMTNTVRHAHARHVTVTITATDDLTVEISDDGNGLPDAFAAGVGVTSMRERAAELGGVCVVEPRSPRGTVVRAVIPLERP